jgi:hypothetical protein
MKKVTFSVLGVSVLLVLLVTTVFAQPGPIGPASEWEATGFNNGVRMVRDANGYFHAFWHSQSAVNNVPNGANCNIMYSFTRLPAAEPPSMANQGAWMPPLNMTAPLGNKDNRYPSVAIEYETWLGPWNAFNRLHVVWQAILPGGNRYEVLYANITLPIPNPPPYPVPAPWIVATNLSNTLKTDSLVPAIAINRYNPNNLNQHLHVVWQEEDINNNNGLLPPPQEDAWFSDIAYIRSINNGLNWAGPAGGWNGNVWDNLARTAANSQMPSIGCALDLHMGIPHGANDFGYNSTAVHVSYNEDVGNGIHVFYLRSNNDGVVWAPRVDVTLATGGVAATRDAYSNIAVNMIDNPYIAFMRNNMNQREPMRTTGINDYLPGIDPTLWRSFPGPEAGMYNALVNTIISGCFNGAAWNTMGWAGGDLEFPTVALDRWQHENVNWQQYVNATQDYEIIRAFRFNLNPPGAGINYGPWNMPVNDSNDANNDDLFPNLAHKKVAMYLASIPGPPPVPNEARTAGYDEIWTKIIGHGRNGAFLSPKAIFQDGNMQYGP